MSFPPLGTSAVIPAPVLLQITPEQSRILKALSPTEVAQNSVWFLVGNAGMDYGDYYWGLKRDYERDPFPEPLVVLLRLILLCI